MKVVAICGSMKPESTTRKALGVALAGAAAAGADTAWVAIDGLPPCDGRHTPYGDRVDRYRAEIATADALLIGSPEYHGSFTGTLKNALDLLGPDDVGGKMVGLVAVATGDAGAMNTLNHLRHVMRWVNAWVLPSQVSIPRAADAFSPDGTATRAGLAEELDLLGRELVRYGKLLRG